MKQIRDFASAVVSQKAERSIRGGHPWVYDAEIKDISGEYQNGGLVDVVSLKGAYLGTGFISESSKIRIRILSQNANERFDDSFFVRRVKYAVDFRKTVMGDDFSCCRLIFGEADGLPGLTVDRYNNILVTEVLSRGTDKVKDVIYRALCSCLAESGEKIDGIYERNESPIRTLEELECYKGWYKSEFVGVPGSVVTEINENGIKYLVDVENGQKTGFFLDQKYNRLAVSKLAKEASSVCSSGRKSQLPGT